jgi:hypothetical protein
MAYYGIPSAGLALTASTANDTVALANLGGTTLTANQIYGLDGNDIISLGAVGRTAIATASFKSGIRGATNSGVNSLTAVLVGSATYTNSRAVATGIQSATVGVTGVITSQQAARNVNATLLQANAGNDTILLGDSLQRVSASTFGGGAGNDFIAGGTNVNNQFEATVNALSGATIVGTNFEGGNGNDTIALRGSALYTSVNLNANEGNDSLDLNAAMLQNSILGMGGGNDVVSGGISSLLTSTIAGGKGNDTIQLFGTTNTQAVIGGDRANNDNQDGDGNDSIFLQGTTISSTVYGGGGNDSITWSAAAGSSNFISLNAGFDVFSAASGAIVLDSTVGLGNNGDLFSMNGSSRILSSNLNLGQGLDTVQMGGQAVSDANIFGSTTIVGGAGNDLLLNSATIANNGTVQTILGYNSDSESTISAFDTVAVSIGAGASGNYQFRYEPGANAASFSAAGYSATNGVVTFTSTFATDVTARAQAVSTASSSGNASVFIDGAGISYLFVKGSSQNLVVQVGTAAVSGGLNDASLSVGAGKNITLGLG